MGISAAEYLRRMERITLQTLQQQVAEMVETDKNRELRKAKHSELEFGYRPSGKKIGKYANDNYAFAKHNQNPLAGYGYVDLIRTGATVNSLFPVRTGAAGRFIFASHLDLFTDLQNKYGKDIAGLSQKTFNVIQRDIYAPDLVKFIKSYAKIS